MIGLTTNRPRNVDVPRAAAILYGDWGTPQRGSLLLLLRGNIIRRVSDLLPDDVHLLVCA